MTGRYSGMALLIEAAPAKGNLTLAVRGRRADGYHLLDSLVVFAGVGDRLTLAPGPALTLKVRGATAEQAGAIESNLVFKAAVALAARMNFEEADENDDDELNDILWRAIRKDAPPPPMRSIFGR